MFEWCTGWDHTAWIDFAQATGTCVLGIVGAWYIRKQNKILQKQNEIFEPLNKFLLETEVDKKLNEEIEHFILAISEGILMPENSTAQMKDFLLRGMTAQKLKIIRNRLGADVQLEAWEIVQNTLRTAIEELDLNKLPKNRHAMTPEEILKNDSTNSSKLKDGYVTSEQLLQKHENKLMTIKKRLYMLKAFEEALEKATRGKCFYIKNRIIYETLTDSWHQMVIDFCSLCVDMNDRGGFFNRLNNHLNELRLAKKKDIDPAPGSGRYVGNIPTEEEQKRHKAAVDDHFAGLILQYNQEAFYRIFPLAKDRTDKKIKQEDVAHLKSVFKEIAESVIIDRNRNRAHRYERRQDKEQAPFLSIKELESKFKQVENLLNDVRLISNMSTLAYTDMNDGDVDQTAEDLVDLVLFGNSKLFHEGSGMNFDLKNGGGNFGWTYREKYYDKLHALHELKHAEIHEKAAKKCRDTFSYVDLKIPPIYFNALEKYK